MTKEASNVIVVGAGILGVSTASQLVRRGVAVTLVNDGPVGNGASGRSLSWLNSARVCSEAYHRLRMAGIDRYRTLSHRFPTASWLSFKGGLMWDPDDATNRIDATFRRNVSLAYEAVHVDAGSVSEVTPGVDARAVTPQGAIFNPGEGWFDLSALIDVLLADFVRHGGKLVTDQGPAHVVVRGGRATGVSTSTG